MEDAGRCDYLRVQQSVTEACILSGSLGPARALRASNRPLVRPGELSVWWPSTLIYPFALASYWMAWHLWHLQSPDLPPRLLCHVPAIIITTFLMYGFWFVGHALLHRWNTGEFDLDRETMSIVRTA